MLFFGILVFVGGYMQNDYIKGSYKSSIFEKNTFVIGLFKVEETNIEEMSTYVNRTITFKGVFETLNRGDLYMFYGKCVEHPKYGFQFDVTNYEIVKPEGKDAVIAYLSSGIFTGIGKNTARIIVNTLGEDALDLIVEDKNVLDKIPKLSSKKKALIYNTLKENEDSRKSIVELTNRGFNMNDASEIYKVYKENTLKTLEYNPYSLINVVKNITFTKIDEIRSNFDIGISDSRRLEACIIYCMNELSFENGDTYFYYDEIMNKVSSYNHNNIDINLIGNCIDNLEADLKIIKEEEKYFLADIYNAEEYIASRINDLALKQPNNFVKIDKHIKELEKQNNIIYNDIQKEAIKKAINNHVTIITGGPGVGKTTIIKAILDVYRKVYKLDSDSLIERVMLLAPTGRAAKRMMESTKFRAKTIHSFLRWNKEDNTFSVNEFDKDFHRFFVIDEVSMIDNDLFYNLLKGLRSNIKLVLVGDFNQLPSVRAGNILRDLIDSNIVDVVHLSYLYRQKDTSYIPVLAREIKDNKLSNFLEKKDDYIFLKCGSEGIIPKLIDACHLAINKGYDYKKIQVMAPMYAGINGIDNLNKVLQNIFNPRSSDKREISYGDIIYRVGDKVLQLVNIPDFNVFNGDIGIIIAIEESSETESGRREVVIDFDGNIVRYDTASLINIRHGFIMSIHKSQGSEFDLVIMTICNSYKRMLYRKLIYTGITRAKRKRILIGEDDAFIYSVENTREHIRKTDLINKMHKIENMKHNNHVYS